jgi:hypothetical protein
MATRAGTPIVPGRGLIGLRPGNAHDIVVVIELW